MASQSFHLEDTETEAKNLPIPSETYSITQNPYKCSPKKQEKEFLQLYIKARARDSENQTKQKLRLQMNSFSAKASKRKQDENQCDEIPSPKTAGNIVARKAILKNLDINNLSSTFTPNKPSKFKLNHEFNVVARDQEDEAQISDFEVSYRDNNQSLHEIEFKEANHVSECPASIDILLPALKENHPQTSNDLEAHNVQTHENAVELEQPEEPRNEERNQQEHENRSRQIPNQDHRSNLTTTNTHSPSNRIVFGRNVEKAYTKVLKFYLVWFLSYGILLGFDFGIFPYFIIFMFAFIFESYFIYEICKEGSQQRQFDPLQEKRKLNSSFQILSIILLEILGLIKYIGVDFPLSIATIPVFLTTIFSCYLYNSGDRRGSYSLTVVFQTLLSMQILTLCLKIDSVLQWSWQGVFWVSWAFLAVTLLYCVGLFMTFFFFLCFEESNVSRSYQLAGLVWILTALSGSAGVLFFLLYGFTDQLEYGNDQNKISKALIGGMSHILFLAAYTWLVKNKIKRFLRRIVGPDARTEQQELPKVRFEKATEGLPSYIVRFTPSYFLTFDDSLKVKDGLKLRNLKKKISLMKLYQYRRFIPGMFLKEKENLETRKHDKMPLVENHVNIDVDGSATNHLKYSVVNQVPPHAKRILAQRVNASEINSPDYPRSKPKCYGSEMRTKVDKPEEVLSIEEEKNEKLCFSANDIEFMRKIDADDFLAEVKTPLRISKKAASEKDEEKTCIICFDKYPDAVMMGCGHGGICYECALESCKKSQECFMCRGKVDKILHIDTSKLSQFNMGKVLSATKVVKDKPQTEDYRITENYGDAMYVARNHL